MSRTKKDDKYREEDIFSSPYKPSPMDTWFDGLSKPNRTRRLR